MGVPGHGTESPCSAISHTGWEDNTCLPRNSPGLDTAVCTALGRFLAVLPNLSSAVQVEGRASSHSPQRRREFSHTDAHLAVACALDRTDLVYQQRGDYSLGGTGKVLHCPWAFAGVLGTCLGDDKGKCLLLSLVSSLGFLTSSQCLRKMLYCVFQLCVGLLGTVEYLTVCQTPSLKQQQPALKGMPKNCFKMVCPSEQSHEKC